MRPLRIHLVEVSVDVFNRLGKTVSKGHDLMVSEKISGRSNFEAQFAEKSGLTQEQVQQKRAQFGVNEIPVHEDNPLMGTLKRL